MHHFIPLYLQTRKLYIPVPPPVITELFPHILQIPKEAQYWRMRTSPTHSNGKTTQVYTVALPPKTARW